jgi:hypothetical protein
MKNIVVIAGFVVSAVALAGSVDRKHVWAWQGAGDCHALVSGNAGYCKSNDCKAVVGHNAGYCDSSDGNAGYCESNGCKAVVSGNAGYCS